MAVFTAGRKYSWPDGSRQRIPPPSVPFGPAPPLSMTLIGGRTISYSRIYREQPWVAAAVGFMVRQISRLPLDAFVAMSSNTVGSVDRKKIRKGDHPLADLMECPAERRSPLQLKADIALGLMVQGNHLERIVRERPGRPPQALEKIDWRTAQPVLSSDGMRVIAWRITPLGGGEPEILGPEDVVHFAWPAPDGPIGVSPLQQLGTTLRSEDAAQRYGESSMENGGMRGLGLVMSPDAARDEVQRETLREEVRNRHSGPDRAFNPYILSGVERIEQLPTQTAVEAELINQRYVNREEVAAVIGVPPVLIQDLRHATYSNVTEMHGMLYVTVLGPWLTLIAETFMAQLVYPTIEWSSVWVEWSLDEVLRGDTAKRYAAYKLAVSTGALTINDVRRKENLPTFDIPAADEPLVLGNNMKLLSRLFDADATAEDITNQGALPPAPSEQDAPPES